MKRDNWDDTKAHIYQKFSKENQHENAFDKVPGICVINSLKDVAGRHLPRSGKQINFTVWTVKKRAVSA